MTGLSLGEYCALVFAGVMSFEDGLKVVKARGESMAAAATLGQPPASSNFESRIFRRCRHAEILS